MIERGGGRAGWIGEWGEGERRRQGWMYGEVGWGREEGLVMDGWGSCVSERRGGRAGWMEEWVEGERMGQGWMDWRKG